MRLDRVAVIGAGAWGTALAQAAALAGRDVMLVARGPAAADEINERHTTAQPLAGPVLSPTTRAMTRSEGPDLAIRAEPAQASRAAQTVRVVSRLMPRRKRSPRRRTGSAGLGGEGVRDQLKADKSQRE